jgi:hypothetical protein
VFTRSARIVFCIETPFRSFELLRESSPKRITPLESMSSTIALCLACHAKPSSSYVTLLWPDSRAASALGVFRRTSDLGGIVLAFYFAVACLFRIHTAADCPEAAARPLHSRSYSQAGRRQVCRQHSCRPLQRHLGSCWRARLESFSFLVLAGSHSHFRWKGSCW